MEKKETESVKRPYADPQVTVIVLPESDVITTSTTSGGSGRVDKSGKITLPWD